MGDQPLISIVIPTYNRADVICHTIDNVLAQTYRNTEIIVVDDGSTDNTVDRLQGFGDRIRVISQPNGGPGAARNRGIFETNGEYIAFQDSDDLWLPTKLERQHDLLNRAGPEVVCCLCNAIFRYRGRPEFTSFRRSWMFPPLEEGVWTNPAEVLATRFVLFCQTVLVRADVLKRAGGFDEAIKYNEDYELPLRLALEGPWAYIREPLMIWQQGAAGSWSDKALNEEISLKECEVKLRLKILSRLGEDRCHVRVRQLLLRELARNRRELWRARMTLKGRPASAAITRALALIDRYCWAIYRRSPSYPKIEARGVVASASFAGISSTSNSSAGLEQRQK